MIFLEIFEISRVSLSLLSHTRPSFFSGGQWLATLATYHRSLMSWFRFRTLAPASGSTLAYKTSHKIVDFFKYFKIFLKPLP